MARAAVLGSVAPGARPGSLRVVRARGGCSCAACSGRLGIRLLPADHVPSSGALPDDPTPTRSSARRHDLRAARPDRRRVLGRSRTARSSLVPGHQRVVHHRDGLSERHPQQRTPRPPASRRRSSPSTDDQRLGQLLMVGFDTNASLGSLDRAGRAARTSATSSTSAAGTVPTKVTRTSEHLQGLVSGKSTGDVGLLIAADQEGGEVHQLRGEGFTRPPSAKEQATMSSAALTRAATGWARELKAAGVNVNLAPVTDTVPDDIGRANEPIGRYGRQYGSTRRRWRGPRRHSSRGCSRAASRARSSTSPAWAASAATPTSASRASPTGSTDADDPFLQPFADGIEAGAGLVMVGSARYSKLDPKVPAMFSTRDHHRPAAGQIGYDGVVITDDVNAKAVRGRAPPDARGAVHRRRRRHRAHRRARRAPPTMIAAVKAEAARRPGVRREGRRRPCSGCSPSRSGWACSPAPPTKP